MKRILFVILVALSVGVAAQDKNNFEASGDPIVRIFANFQSGITSADNSSVFEIQRALFGYKYKMSPELSAQVVLDIGSPNDESVYAMVKRYAYFRNAYVKYAKGNLDISLGILGMNNFKVQESFWGYRYIEKSFMDKYKFAGSVDLGLLAKYKLNDWAKIDAAIVNGEGYSQLQSDSYFEYTLGLTLDPIDKIQMRLFTNIEPSDDETKRIYAFFLGYKPLKDLSVGAEANFLNNYKFRDNYNLTGYSFFTTYKANDNWKIFARYDILQSNILDGDTTPWNLASDETALYAGIERKINSKLKVSLNYRDEYARAANMDDKSYIYFNLEFKL